MNLGGDLRMHFEAYKYTRIGKNFGKKKRNYRRISSDWPTSVFIISGTDKYVDGLLLTKSRWQWASDNETDVGTEWKSSPWSKTNCTDWSSSASTLFELKC